MKDHDECGANVPLNDSLGGSYESWRISYQSSEQAARAAWAECERLRGLLHDLLTPNA